MAESGVGPGDLVFDLGAGTGGLTLPLIDAGAEVVAIEMHPDRVARLREQVDGRAKVVRADLQDLYLPRRPFRVVANPPFALTTHLVRTLLASGSLRSADLVLQRGAARGMAARPPVVRGGQGNRGQGNSRQGSNGRDGHRRSGGRGRAGPVWHLQVGRHLPAQAFAVPPSVDSAVLQVRR